jgi:hypothetical protein
LEVANGSLEVAEKCTKSSERSLDGVEGSLDVA